MDQDRQTARRTSSGDSKTERGRKRRQVKRNGETKGKKSTVRKKERERERPKQRRKLNHKASGEITPTSYHVCFNIIATLFFDEQRLKNESQIGKCRPHCEPLRLPHGYEDTSSLL